MHDDDLILLGAYVLLALTVTTLTLRSKNKSKTILHHITVLTLYSAPLLYGILARSEHGNTLAWWFYLLLACGLHLLVVIFMLVRTAIGKPRGV